MTSCPHSKSGSFKPFNWNICRAWRIGASGFLNSCPSIARNSFFLELAEIFVAPLYVHNHAGGNGFVKREPDCQDFTGMKGTPEILVEEFEKDQTKDLEIANDFDQRPAGSPTLLAMLFCGQEVLAGVGLRRFGEAL